MLSQRRLSIAASYALIISTVSLLGCGSKQENATQDTPSLPSVNEPNTNEAHATKSASQNSGYFTDITKSLGPSLKRSQWSDGQFLTPEITPGGVAIFDYNNDGLPDIYLVCHCEAGSLNGPAPNRLFRQEASGHFTEVPGAAGLDDPGFGHGVAVGDIDNDGDLDVYVTNYGPDAFFLNDGEGNFVNQTEAAGIAGDRWSSSAGFLDYDRDGLLDLYVVNFAIFDKERVCTVGGDPTNPDFCGPHVFDGLLDTLYHNNGDGTFTDVTEAAGINLPGRGWGLACADVTGDGWCDVYIANDEEPAQLWVNQQDGRFEEEAVFRGCAFNSAGRVEAGMGVGIADIDGDQRLDLFKTHISGETNTLYLSGGESDLYTDNTQAGRMGAVDRPYTGWGCGFFDFNHDGHLDMAVANGRVSKGVPQSESPMGRFWSRFSEPNLLFAGDDKSNFKNVSSQAGAFGSDMLISRGLAMADLDADGDLDLVVQHLDNLPRVYRNDAPLENTHWLLVRPMTNGRDAYGATVVIEVAGKKTLRLAHPASSYLASNDPRAHFGLGKTTKIDSLEITWPSGRVERFAPPEVDQEAIFKEGTGETLEQ